MHRLGKLEKEINKNLKIDERSNIQIVGWSPNNVRRLIITKDFGVVQYHKTGGRYKKLVEVVDLRKEYKDDINLLQEGKYKKSVLGVLTSGRICSMVEEIYFIYDGYNISLLEKDMDISVLGRGKQAIENRFVRLHVIGVLSNNSYLANDIVDKSKEGGVLLYDFVKGGILKDVKFNESTWWKGSYLRPKYYIFDKDILEEHFNKIKEEKELELKEKELLEIEKKKIDDLIKSRLPVIEKLTYKVEDIQNKLDSIFQDSSLINKGEWALYGKRDVVDQLISKVLRDKWEKSNYRGIDVEKLRDLISNEIVENIEGYIKLVLKEEMYKQEVKKLSLKDSIVCIENVLKDLLMVLSSVVYGVLAKYILRNTKKYSKYYYEKLGIIGLTYTMSHAEFVNRFYDVDDSGDVFRNVGIDLVDVSNYKLTDIDKILAGLQRVTKE